MDVYIGTYTEPAQNGKAAGIYHCRFDPASGALTEPRLVARGRNPSFLALIPSGRFLYTVNELGDTAAGTPGGAISAYTVERSSGDLTFLNTQPTHGTFPAHLTVDPTGHYVLAANYGTGNLAVYRIEADGRLGVMTDLIQNTGSGPDTQRQEGPHAHMIAFDPSDRWAVLVDLGIDQSLVYRLDTVTGKLTAQTITTATGTEEHSAAHATPGEGPRHIAFYPTNRYAYVINELAATIDAFAWDAPSGTFQRLQTISTLPAGYADRRSCAEIVVHPSGRFVYGSNRGHDSVAIFAVNEGTGILTALSHQSTGGKEPRSIALDPSGAFLLAANQHTDTIVTFRVDPSSGQLTPTGQIAQVPTPVCVLFAAT